MSALFADARLAAHCPPPRIAKTIRQTAGLTQQDLATELGVHVVTVARWECGTNRPRGRMLARYSSLLQQLHESVI